MTTLKTQPTDASVDEFLESVSNAKRREDAYATKKLMEDITGLEPRMWGSSLVGFGHYEYQYSSGRRGEWFITGFSPRKQALTIYIMPGFGRFDAIMSRLGKYKTGVSCLYIKNLEDVDLKLLEELIRLSIVRMKEIYET